MKELYSFIILCILIPLSGKSQGSLGSQSLQFNLSQANYQPIKAKHHYQKAGGDTLFYEDFGGGTSSSLPTGWTTVDNNSLGYDWIWSNTAPGGQFSVNIPPLASTSSSNGYLCLPADLYNTPISLAVSMDTWVQSPVFSIPAGTPSVFVKFEQFQRYCCSSSNELVLEVSSNGTNWSVPYDATIGRTPNTMTPNGEIVDFNVSADLVNQLQGYIRLRSFGNTHYFWMVDDLLVYEGPENSLEVESLEIDFHNGFSFSPVYTQLPIINATIPSFTAYTKNIGLHTATNAQLDLEVYHDSVWGGGAGLGRIFNDSTIIGSGTLPRDSMISATLLSSQASNGAGWYRNKFVVTSDSVNQIAWKAETEYSYALTNDTVFALDRGASYLYDAFGPASLVNGGNDSDAIANLLILDSSIMANLGGIIATSISVYIYDNLQNSQVQISPRIWRFNEDSVTTTISNGFVGGLVASSPFSRTITSADYNSWVSLPLFPPVVLGAGQYYFGVEQTAGQAQNARLLLGRDIEQEEFMGDMSTLVYLNSSSQWVDPRVLAGIRFNGFYAVGIDEKFKLIPFEDWSIYPNPSNGEFTLQLTSSTAANYQMKVRSMTGQTVMSHTLSVNGLTRQQLDLSSFEKGIYFVSLENGEERLVKKIVVQ